MTKETMKKTLITSAILSLATLTVVVGLAYSEFKSLPSDIKSASAVEVVEPIDTLSSKLNKAVNKIRLDNSLEPLTINSELTKSAQYRADELCRTGNWSHDGWENSITYSYHKVGENLAKGYRTNSDMVQAWVDSPKHYENIVDDYSDTGFGFNECNGKKYVVQHFGNPKQ